MARFKLMVGKHVEKGKVYRKGDIITTDDDLTRLNGGPGAMKFERLSAVEDPGSLLPRSVEGADRSHAIPAPARDNPVNKGANLDKMSLTDLQAYADEEEIDLKGAKTRDDVLKQIKAAQAQPAVQTSGQKK